MNYINQINKSDCLFTTLKNFLASIYNDKRFLYLPEDESHGQYSFIEIKEIAYEYGVTLEGFRVIDKKEILKNKNFPLIVSLNQNDGLHSVLLLKVNKLFVTYYDPSSGYKHVSLNKFLRHWTGQGLIKTNFIKKDFNFKIPVFYKKKSIFIMLLLQILSAASIIAGIFLLNKNIPSPYPIICFSLTAIFEVLFRSYSMNKMKEIDKNIISSWNFNNETYSFYERLETSKTANFKLINSFVFNFILALFLVAICVLNSLYNIMIIGVVLILSLLDAFIATPKLNAYKNNLSLFENDYLRSKDKDTAISKLNLLHDKTYKYGYLTFLVTALEVIFIFLTVLLATSISGNYSVTNCIFYLFIGVYLNKAFTSIFLVDDKIMDVKIAKTKLMNVFYPRGKD